MAAQTLTEAQDIISSEGETHEQAPSRQDAQPTVDRRRRQWFPASVDIATGRTGTRILKEFGLDGFAVWVAFLAACKRNRVQGEIEYHSEAEGWAILGLAEHRPAFSLEEFFKFTGRLKKTARTPRGRITNVRCSRWGDWTKATRRDQAAERSSRKRAGKGRDNVRTIGELTATATYDSETDSEAVRELDLDLTSSVDRLITLVGGRENDILALVQAGLPQRVFDDVADDVNRRWETINNPAGYAVSELRRRHNEIKRLGYDPAEEPDYPWGTEPA